MQSLISIIVPVYNTQQYISDCLESILRQTYKNIEVIVVDDGSTDGSLEICISYSKKDSRIMVIPKVHAGLVEARKSGINKARGEYCMFVDGDDWIVENLIESILPLMEEGNVDIVNYNLSTVNGDTIEKWCYTIPDGIYGQGQLKNIYTKMMFDFDNGKPGIIQSLCTKLIKRNILRESISNVDGNVTLGEDAAVVYRAMITAKKIAITNESFYFYRIHAGSMTTSKNKNIFSDISYFQQYMLKVFEGYSEEYGLNEQLRMYMMHFIEKGIRDFLSISFVNPYSVPFNLLRVLNGKVVLYGAGKIGRAYYRQLRQIKDIEIVAWLDREPGKKYGYGYKIEKPDYLKTIDFNQILIAIANEKVAKEIKEQLYEFTSEERILWEKPQKKCLERELDGI
ncbi:MAG: glycosyltransferase [Lachnospiraceae bacterium]|nr:glycosyltransferase [Lachnospiraceae bacterium]